MATINEALKSLILAVGGDPASMYDNTTVSDYIKDLETALIEQGSGAQIDDTTASETTVYSSSKTESVIAASDKVAVFTCTDLALTNGATMGDVRNAINAGKVIFLVCSSENETGHDKRYRFMGVTDADEGVKMAQFVYIGCDTDDFYDVLELRVECISINVDETNLPTDTGLNFRVCKIDHDN